MALAYRILPDWVGRRFRALLGANYLTAETTLVHLRDRWLWLLVASLTCGLLVILFVGYVLQALRAPRPGTRLA